jgi:hypothetical protein
MDVSQSPYKEFYQLALECALEAGALIKQGFEKKNEITFKNDVGTLLDLVHA